MAEGRTPSKQEILTQAAQCFMERGFHATSIDDVARRLGSTKGRVYHHYASKVELFFDVHREGMAHLFAAIEPARQTGGDAMTVLTAMLRAHAMAVLEHHTFESVVAQGVQIHRFGATTPGQRATLDELIASRDRFEQLFKDQVSAARQEGSLADVDVSIAVKTLLGGIQWSLIWYRPEADADADARARLADQMVRTLIDGVRTRQPAPSRRGRSASAQKRAAS
ncbi:TetR/AcrR family transcriptional regulator [Cupriavidus respiraculi]|uniref:TetR/AcrR family transcriptional regulator n=1 Tax=Cupriavidus respiraculi TaxID=195930 RepID=UPI001C96CE26|nr:TetR family transcriptional regulator [Cupriavidus respiraculi]MBY4947413.1 TetR/AcrR family transcriptional regulator [Cupriavidus respiraculi]